MDKTEEIKNVLKFMEEARAGIDRGESKEFVCPICGGNARATKDSCNGHLHAGCDNCGMCVME